jgi:hypothetical protein
MAADPRDPHAEERRQERIARYEEGIRELDAPDTRHLTAQAIVDCELCDDDGYRGNRVCDHVDRSEIAARGSAAVRAALAKGGAE